MHRCFSLRRDYRTKRDSWNILLLGIISCHALFALPSPNVYCQREVIQTAIFSYIIFMDRHKCIPQHTVKILILYICLKVSRKPRFIQEKKHYCVWFEMEIFFTYLVSQFPFLLFLNAILFIYIFITHQHDRISVILTSILLFYGLLLTLAVVD